MANKITQMASGIGDAFVELIIAAVVISVLAGLSLVNSSSFVDNVVAKVQDGMLQIIGIIVLTLLLAALALVRRG
jgi:Na+/H+-dicarboxylate symporter